MMKLLLVAGSGRPVMGKSPLRALRPLSEPVPPSTPWLRAQSASQPRHGSEGTRSVAYQHLKDWYCQQLEIRAKQAKQASHAAL
jgi:hypothetical protein